MGCEPGAHGEAMTKATAKFPLGHSSIVARMEPGRWPVQPPARCRRATVFGPHVPTVGQEATLPAVGHVRGTTFASERGKLYRSLATTCGSRSVRHQPMNRPVAFPPLTGLKNGRGSIPNSTHREAHPVEARLSTDPLSVTSGLRMVPSEPPLVDRRLVPCYGPGPMARTHRSWPGGVRSLNVRCLLASATAIKDGLSTIR